MSENVPGDGSVAHEIPDPVAGYAPPEKRPPLLAYLSFMSTFGALVAAGLAVAKRQGRELPERVPAGQLLLVGTASHKVSRLPPRTR